MAEIPLTQGKVALIDDADLPLGQDRKWYALRRNSGEGWYAVSNISRRIGGGTVYMHRLLFPDAIRVDHKNNDGLDNRRSTGNVRPCTQGQNLANQPKCRGGSSRFKGVYWEKSRGRWAVRVGYRGRHVWLGYFADEVAAAKAYNDGAIGLYGDFAQINPLEDPSARETVVGA